MKLLMRSFLCCFILFFFGCKTISIQNKEQQITTQPVVLGSIGLDEIFIKRTYDATGIPVYNKPIKVLVIQVPFNKASFKAYSEARQSQTAKININYADSLEQKPSFVNLQIIDKVGLINALNDKSNNDIITYLANQKESHIVTNVSMAFNQTEIKAINKSEEVFLEANGIKSYALYLYKDKQLVNTISFNQGILFAYRTSNFCWRENSKSQLIIVEIIEGNKKCPVNTYKSSNRAKKKIDYFKF